MKINVQRALAASIALLVSACSGGGSGGGGASASHAEMSLVPRHSMSASGQTCFAYPEGSLVALDNFYGKLYFYTPSSSGYVLSATIKLPGTAGDANGHMAFDANGDLWVAYTDNYHSPTTAAVVEYAAPLTDNETPALTISGANTGLHYPVSISYNASTDTVIVGDYTAQTLSVFSDTANGDVAPLRTISGAATQLNAPWEIRSDAQSIYVANAGTSPAAITEYPLTGSGNIAPSVTLNPNGQFSNQVTGFDFTTNGNLYVDYNAQFPIGFYTLLGGYNGQAAAYMQTSAGNATDAVVDDQGNFWTTDQVSSIKEFAPPRYGVSTNQEPVLTIATPARNLVSLAIFSPAKLGSPYPK